MKKRFLSAAVAAVSLAAMLCGCSTSNSTTNSTSDSSSSSVSSSTADSVIESSAPSESSATSENSTPSDNENTNSLTSLEVIRQMGNGINLGNTLESYGHSNYLDGEDPATLETLWGQPMTTADMFTGMKAAGFDTVRIPITWLNGINIESGDFTIDERLMNRVDTIVNWALDADLYVIINDHWDGGWWAWFGQEDQATRDKAMEFYKSLWTQVGEHFKDASYKLIFESANEELGNRLNDMTDFNGQVKGVLTEDECYETTNRINSEFVKLIRSQGGKNADRFLLIAGYNTDIEKTCDDRFKMPEDSADSKLLLSVHYYSPWNYCGTASINKWGSPKEYIQQNDDMKALSKFSEQGYGVVIGEYAVITEDNTVKPDTDKFYNNLLNNCDLYDFCPVLWDRSDIFDRAGTKAVTDETLANLYDTRRYANETSVDDVKAAAQTALEEALKTAEETYVEEPVESVSDGVATAWIMYASGDWSTTYNNGDVFDPNNGTPEVKPTNVVIEGEGSYTVSLDLSECNEPKETAFSALGIANGEQLFPGYTYTIDSVLLNGTELPLSGKGYTTSDDGKCTRVNLYNEWVSDLPAEARTADGDLTDCSPCIIDLGSDVIQTLTVNFTVKAPQ